ncbi:M20 metallopeptidase family protein [Pilibacter termitis]|nr:amidohydrolase [Pilibacter termitis]
MRRISTKESSVSMKNHRMNLHQIAEIGFQEFQTKAYLYEQVKNCGAVVHEVGETGLVLYFDNQKEKTIAFRTDIDALPILEETGLPFASKREGFMHACGHDGHMAMLLGLTDYIAKNREKMKYNIVLIYQPSEEIAGGAKSILDSGLLQHYQVQAIFGFHLWPTLEEGAVFSKSGPLMAQSSETDIQIFGKSAHIASSSEGIDSLEVAVRLMSEIYDYEKKLPEEMLHLLKFGEIHGGVIRNVLAQEVTIKGSIRSYSPLHQQEIKDSLRKIANRFEEEFQAKIEFIYNDGYPAVLNNSELFDKIKSISTLRVLEHPVLQAEDFGVYTEHFPCVFFFLGVGDVPALHNPKFDFNMDVLDNGLEFYKALLEIENY